MEYSIIVLGYTVSVEYLILHEWMYENNIVRLSSSGLYSPNPEFLIQAQPNEKCFGEGKKNIKTPPKINFLSWLEDYSYL